MFFAEIMVPCLQFGGGCRPDWSAVSAVGGWVAAAATFLAVYVPAKNYKKDNERRAHRERQVSYIEINRLVPKVLDVRAQIRIARARVLPAIPKALARPGSSSAEIADLLRIKGTIPFAILSDGLENISIGVSNLQTCLDVVADFVEAGEAIPIYANHPFHRLTNFEAALAQAEDVATDLLREIKKSAGIDVVELEADVGKQ